MVETRFVGLCANEPHKGPQSTVGMFFGCAHPWMEKMCLIQLQVASAVRVKWVIVLFGKISQSTGSLQFAALDFLNS